MDRLDFLETVSCVAKLGEEVSLNRVRATSACNMTLDEGETPGTVPIRFTELGGEEREVTLEVDPYEERVHTPELYEFDGFVYIGERKYAIKGIGIGPSASIVQVPAVIFEQRQ